MKTKMKTNTMTHPENGYRAKVNTVSRIEAARLGHYKQRLKQYCVVRPYTTEDDPVRSRQLDALVWYPKTRNILRDEVWPMNVWDVEPKAWVMATLSPMTTYEQNLKDTQKFFSTTMQVAIKDDLLNGTDEAVMAAYTELRMTAYKANVRKCVSALLKGYPDAPTGPKVSAFYAALCGDQYSEPPVIDLWMVRAATGDMKATTVSTKRMALIERAVVELWNEIPAPSEELWAYSWHDLQALIWSNVRGGNR